MPILEDGHGTYIMNFKDLHAVERIERLVKIGVDSLKIEGRTKSLYYVAKTAQVYRRANDDAVTGRPFNENLMDELQGLANRGYSDGFYQPHHTQDHQNYMDGVSQAHRSRYIGNVKSINDGWTKVEVKNRFSVSDGIEVIHPNGNQVVTLESMQTQVITTSNVGSDGGQFVKIPIDTQFNKPLLARLL